MLADSVFLLKRFGLDSREPAGRGIPAGSKGRELEGVVQAQLHLARRGTNAGDLPEVTVLNVVIGISVAGDVEDIEEVSAETKYMLLPDVEVFEQRHVDLSITGRALAAIMCRTESVRSR